MSNPSSNGMPIVSHNELMNTIKPTLISLYGAEWKGRVVHVNDRLTHITGVTRAEADMLSKAMPKGNKVHFCLWPDNIYGIVR